MLIFYILILFFHAIHCSNLEKLNDKHTNQMMFVRVQRREFVIFFCQYLIKNRFLIICEYFDNVRSEWDDEAFWHFVAIVQSEFHVHFHGNLRAKTNSSRKSRSI